MYICVHRHAQLWCDFPAPFSGYWWGFKLGVVRIVPLPLFMPRPSLISSSHIIHPHTGPCCSDCFLVRMLLCQRNLLVLPQLVKVQALEYKIFALTDSKRVHQLFFYYFFSFLFRPLIAVVCVCAPKELQDTELSSAISFKCLWLIAFHFQWILCCCRGGWYRSRGFRQWEKESLASPGPDPPSCSLKLLFLNLDWRWYRGGRGR